jgi:hypothetical protein
VLTWVEGASDDMPEAAVYRVQDAEGRGPFRPGLSAQWSDREGDAWPAPYFDLWPDWRRLVPGGWWYGSAVERLEQLDLWFTPAERQRLAGLGFHLAALDRAFIAARDPAQVLIVRRRPFIACRVLPWPP